MRIIGTDTFTLTYDGENRLMQVNKNNVLLSKFYYDGDGRRVKSETYTNGTLTETILFIGAHYEVTNPGSGQLVTKYYFAGAARIAMRKYISPQWMRVEYLFGDHLGSTSLTTDAYGEVISEVRYTAWDENKGFSFRMYHYE